MALRSPAPERINSAGRTAFSHISSLASSFLGFSKLCQCGLNSSADCAVSANGLAVPLGVQSAGLELRPKTFLFMLGHMISLARQMRGCAAQALRQLPLQCKIDAGSH